VGAEAVALARDLEPQVPDVALVAGSARSAEVEVGAKRPAVTRAGATTSIGSPRRRANRNAGSSASVGTVPSTCSVASWTRRRVTSACGASGLASTVSAPPFGRATVKR
jgi:hypothetical protein